MGLRVPPLTVLHAFTVMTYTVTILVHGTFLLETKVVIGKQLVTRRMVLSVG